MRTPLLSLFLMMTGAAAVAQNTPQIELVPWAVGLDTITDIAQAGDDRLFVVQKQGLVMIVHDSMEVAERPFLDVSAQIVTAGGEQGLLGLAFDPDYATNGYFYTNYIAGTGTGASVISRWQVSADPDSADMASEVVIYSYPQPYANHNGGDLAFGPDGMLYIPFGDGGDAGDPQGHAQNLTDPLGDIVRLDVSNPEGPFSIPTDNPWLDHGDTLPEIWASGLRNPWRISFDRLDGDLWIADVGQSNWEEINHVAEGTAGGLNFGWRCYEGTAPFNTIDCAAEDAYTMPVTVHINDGQFSDWCAIIGGYVYRGTAYPHLYGRYIYTDYCKGQIWGLHPDDEGGFHDEMLFEDEELTAWTVIAENAAGELFIGNEFPGDVYKLIDRCPMDAPDLSYDGTMLTSTASDSTYQWYLDNILIEGEDGATLTPTASGLYHVVAVWMGGCALSSDTVAVIVTGIGVGALPLVTMQPNPADDQVTFVWDGTNATGTIRMLDAQGREVYAQRMPRATRSTVQLDAFAPGLYTVQVLNSAGLVLTAEKLLVRH